MVRLRFSPGSRSFNSEPKALPGSSKLRQRIGRNIRSLSEVRVRHP